MKTPVLLELLSRICTERELVLVVHPGGHWQILGGPKIVNWWPLSKGCTVHVSGEKSGRTFVAHTDADLKKLTDLVFN
jgi:hypothetical protein